jgi:predicted phage terminase large subunit-like protein
MTLDNIELIEELAAKEAKENFWVYRQFINPNLKLSWFQKEIAYALMQFYQDYKAGKRPKLIIEAPPQHGKSVQVIEFISWLAGHDSKAKTIYTSFSERLGIRANLRLQRIFDSPKYKHVFTTHLNTSNVVAISGQYLRNREILEYVDSEGYFRNTTIRGSITGESLDIGIIDDPLKGREEAQSATIREKTWDWLTDDFLTRFSDDGALLIIGTRWHIDDPIGRLRDLHKDIQVLSYKAIAEEDEKNRSKGDALFPSHKSIEFLLERKKLMSSLSWESLYQSNPIINTGTLFKQSDFKYYKESEIFIYLGEEAIRKTDLRIYQTIDPAGTVSQTADDFACITFAIHANNIIVLDTFNEQALTTTHDDIMTSLRNKWNPIYQAVEKKIFGLNIIQNAASRGIPVMPLTADGNKIYRAEPLQVHFKNGLVWFKNGFSTLEKQLLEFPNGKHDDLVDCLAYACILVLDKPADIAKVWNEIYA